MSSEMVRYVLVGLALVGMLAYYIHDYAHWHEKLCELPLTFGLALSKVTRATGLTLSVANFFVYVAGSYYMAQGTEAASNTIFFFLCVFIVVDAFALLFANEGFKRENKATYMRRSRFFEEGE